MWWLPPDQDLALPAPSGSLQGSWSLGVSSLKNLTHRIVYQYNFLIFCSGVASSVQCRCAMCRAGDDLALVCACLATSPCWGLLWLASLLVPPCTLPLYSPMLLLHKIFPQPPHFIFTIHTSLCCHLHHALNFSAASTVHIHFPQTIWLPSPCTKFFSSLHNSHSLYTNHLAAITLHSCWCFPSVTI